MPGEIRAHIVADVEVRVGRKAQSRARGIGELRPALAVGLLGALDLGDPLGDRGPGDDELRFAALRLFGPVERLEDGGQVVAVASVCTSQPMALKRSAVFSLWVFAAMASRVTSFES